MAPEPYDDERESRLQELEEIEEEERQKLVKEALGKFNFFLHTTAWAAGCAYLILLGVFVPKTMPYIWIPVGIWTAGLAYHFWRAWHPGTRTERQLRKALKQLRKEEDRAREEQAEAVSREETGGVGGGGGEASEGLDDERDDPVP